MKAAAGSVADLADLVLTFASEQDVLVGGQALVYWTSYFNVTPPSILSAGITSDVDFLTTKADTEIFVSKLNNEFGEKVFSRYAGMDDAAVNIAKAIIKGALPADDEFEIDFLANMQGVAVPQDVKERSVREAAHRSLRVMHPIDCLGTRVWNLDIPRKKSPGSLPKSLGQLKLAMEIVKVYLAGATEERPQLNDTERVIALAQSRAGRMVRKNHNINVLDAIPVQEIISEKFRTIRWPRFLNWYNGRYAAQSE